MLRSTLTSRDTSARRSRAGRGRRLQEYRGSTRLAGNAGHRRGARRAGMVHDLDLDHQEENPDRGGPDRDPREGVAGLRAEWAGPADAAERPGQSPPLAPLDQDQADEE